MEAFSVEGDRAVGATVRAFAAERSNCFAALSPPSNAPTRFELQRLATLEWATAERREAVAEVDRELAASIEALRGKRAVVVDDVRTSSM